MSPYTSANHTCKALEKTLSGSITKKSGSNAPGLFKNIKQQHRPDGGINNNAKMDNPNQTTKETQEARTFKTSLIAEIVMRQAPLIDNVIKLLGQLQNEKLGLLRDMIKREDSEDLELLQAQLKDVEVDLSLTEEYLTSLIQIKTTTILSTIA